MTTVQEVREVLNRVYDKPRAISDANQTFSRLSSTRKEKIIRSLYMNDVTVRRMWEHEGCLHWEVISAKHHKRLEYARYNGEKIDTEGMESYVVIVDKKLKWHCECYWFGKNQELDECTHILQIRLTNCLKEYLPYFIYAYRFLLPDVSYRKFLLEFTNPDISS